MAMDPALNDDDDVTQSPPTDTGNMQSNDDLLSKRQERAQLWKQRKAAKNHHKNKNKKNGNRNNPNSRNKRPSEHSTANANGDAQTEISDKEESEIYQSLMTAVKSHSSLLDDELRRIFENAICKLHTAWFRQHLPEFFNVRANAQQIDIVSLILRLFAFKFECAHTRFNVPFRYLLLDLIAPALHSRHSAHKNTNLLQPLPAITDYHRQCASRVFSLWVLEQTQHAPANDFGEYKRHDDDVPPTGGSDEDDASTEHALNALTAVSLNDVQKFKHKTLQFLTVRQMEALFRAFSLGPALPPRIRRKLCDKVHEWLCVKRVYVAAVEWTVWFDLYFDVPYRLLLPPLLREQTLLHHVVNYVDSIPRNARTLPLIARIKSFVADCLSTLTAQKQTTVPAAKALKLLRNWQMDASLFAPLVESQIKSFLRWATFRGHVDDYAQLLCAQSVSLQLFVIETCHRHPTTYASCVRWAQQWQLASDSRCASLVQHARAWLAAHDDPSTTGNTANTTSSHNKRSPQKPQQNTAIEGYDELPQCEIGRAQIVWVDDPPSLQRAQGVLLADDVDCIGLDLEMVSTNLPVAMPSQCQVLQMSTADTAFLFDLQVMQEVDGFDDLLTSIFCDSAAVKVGMAWQGDLRHLKQQFPDAIAFKSVCTPYLDLMTISKHMKCDGEFAEKAKSADLYDLRNEETERAIKLRYKGLREKEGGLAKVVRWTLQKRLDKFEQLSNWSNRPLRDGQLKYAALDAMVECWCWRTYKQWEQQTILPSLEGFYEDLYGQSN